ncbi:MAG: hypothetical protein ACXWZ3_08025 [Solirubrobacterales bacterium]
MTERATGAVDHTTYYRRPPRLSTRALTVRTVVLSSAAALLVSAGLAWQMALGADPQLGGETAAEQRPRVVQTTVVKRVVGSSSGSSPASASTSVAPAPAPAPAPVSSGSS